MLGSIFDGVSDTDIVAFGKTKILGILQKTDVGKSMLQVAIRTVNGAIIHKDDVIVGVGHRLEGIQAFGRILFLIPVQDDNRDLRLLRHVFLTTPG